jgi:hypothetical protein
MSIPIYNGYSIIEIITELLVHLPIATTLGFLFMIVFFVFLFWRERFIKACIFIFCFWFGAYFRSSFVTQPFFEMFQKFIDYGVHYRGEVPKAIEFLFLFSIQDWLNMAFWFGAAFSVVIGYITYCILEYSLKRLVQFEPKIGIGLLAITAKFVFGKQIQDIFKVKR